MSGLREAAAPVVPRDQVLGRRAAVHDLLRPARSLAAAEVLGVGVQDYPVGASAHLALRVRTAGGAAALGGLDELLANDELALVHGVRGAAHLHRAADLPLYAAALRITDPRDMAVASGGAFWRELAAQGITITGAMDEVAAAMRAVMADGHSRTKGELSRDVQKPVDRRLRPWCEGCQAHHVHDQLFRLASLQAGLRLRRGAPSDPLCFLPPPAGAVPPVDPDAARREVTRRFLRLCGPATADQLGGWLALRPAGARRLWALVADELAEVALDGRRCWMLAADLDELGPAAAPAPETVRLLAPYDPWTELGDRGFLVPDPAGRREVWRAAANPGVLLVAAEIAGVWRQRTARGRLTVTVRPFGRLRPQVRRAAAEEVEDLARAAGATAAELHVQE